MGKVRTGLAVSLDGFISGPDDGAAAPMGAGRAVCSALGTGGRWTPWHAERGPGASGRANDVGHGSGRRAGSARVPGWWSAALAAGVGHASAVRPDASTLGVAEQEARATSAARSSSQA